MHFKCNLSTRCMYKSAKCISATESSSHFRNHHFHRCISKLWLYHGLY